jgi:hypothetical protein
LRAAFVAAKQSHRSHKFEIASGYALAMTELMMSAGYNSYFPLTSVQAHQPRGKFSQAKREYIPITLGIK